MTALSRRLMRLASLAVVPGLSSCTYLPLPPAQEGVAIDCNHFYRNTEGNWQADGNATVFVNGRLWFLGIQQFTPSGPVVGGQDGALLFNDIQRQCGGGPLPVAQSSAGHHNQACHEDGDILRLNGTVHADRAQKDEDPAKGFYRYAYLQLDRPVCLKDPNFPDGETVRKAYLEAKNPLSMVDQHVKLNGELHANMTSNWPLPFTFTPK